MGECYFKFNFKQRLQTINLLSHYSPFCTIITSVLVSGDGIKSEGVLASLPTSFSINSSEDDEVSLEVDIQVCL